MAERKEEVVSPKLPYLCFHCLKEGPELPACSCGFVNYCDDECRKLHQEKHYHTCNWLKERKMSIPSLPSEEETWELIKLLKEGAEEEKIVKSKFWKFFSLEDREGDQELLIYLLDMVAWDRGLKEVRKYVVENLSSPAT